MYEKIFIRMVYYLLNIFHIQYYASNISGEVHKKVSYNLQEIYWTEIHVKSFHGYIIWKNPCYRTLKKNDSVFSIVSKEKG
jgi:hypothetical protein